MYSLWYYVDAIVAIFAPTTPVKQLYLQSKRQLTPDTFLLQFCSPIQLPTMKCGQHIMCTIGDNSRKYTPICANSCSSNGETIDIVVKGYANGVVSKPITELEVGSYLTVSSPTGRNLYLGGGVFSRNDKQTKFNHYLMICAGSGITPMFVILNQIAANMDLVQVDLVYVNKTNADIILRAELDAICETHSNIKCHYMLTRETTDTINIGRPDRDTIADLLVEKDDTIALVCGPPEFNKDMSTICAENGLYTIVY
jgi:ferredoxin-NADP reductase